MARKKLETYKQPSIVSGLSTKDILYMDTTKFNKLNEKELRLVVSRLVSSGNKRIRALEKTGHYIPALESLRDKNGEIKVFTTKGKNLTQLRKEYARARNFMTHETSTVKGYKAMRDKIRNKFENPPKKKITKIVNGKFVDVETDEYKYKPIKITDSQLDMFFRFYRRLYELDRTLKQDEYKYQVFGIIEQVINSDDFNIEEYDEMNEDEQETQFDTMLEKMQNKITELEKKQREIKQVGTSQFFE